jgi:hypothetical protein
VQEGSDPTEALQALELLEVHECSDESRKRHEEGVERRDEAFAQQLPDAEELDVGLDDLFCGIKQNS